MERNTQTPISYIEEDIDVSYIEEMAKKLVTIPVKGTIFIYEGEEMESLLIAYNQIFAVTNDNKAGRVIDMCDYILEQEILIKEQENERELQAIIDGDLYYS